MKEFNHFIKEAANKEFPIKETPANFAIRKKVGLDTLVKVDAKELQKVFEKESKEKLVHKEIRLKKIEDHLMNSGTFDAYPTIGALYDVFAIDDGRHRIAVAAKYNMKIVCATMHESIEPLKKFLKIEVIK